MGKGGKDNQASEEAEEEGEEEEERKRRRKRCRQCTRVKNSLMLRHLIIHFPASSGVSERASKQMSAIEPATKASSAEKANK